METLEQTKPNALTIYGNGYYTSIKEGKLFLQTGDHRVIATYDRDAIFKLYDRDLANCFLDTINPSDVDRENLPDNKFIPQITDILVKDIVQYQNIPEVLFEGRFKYIFDAFDDKNKFAIIHALLKMGVIDTFHNAIVPFKVLRNIHDARKAVKDLKPFVKLCASNQHYDICERTPDGGYVIIAKNGGCGTLKSIVEDKDNKVIVVFDKQSTTKPEHTSKNITKLIEVDLQGTPYKAANRFVKLEESLTKEYNILAEKICEKQGFCDLNKFNYPNLDNETGDIAKLIRHAQKQDTPQETINAIKISLEGLYNSAYKKLEASAKTLNDLIKQYGI